MCTNQSGWMGQMATQNEQNKETKKQKSSQKALVFKSSHKRNENNAAETNRTNKVFQNKLKLTNHNGVGRQTGRRIAG